MALPPTGAPPQFDVPFRLDATGHPVVVEQGSPQEIAAAIVNIVSCPQGAKLNDPNFGIPEPLFSPVPLDGAAIIKAIRRFEPRATQVDIEQTLATRQELDVRITAHSGSGL